MKLYLSSIVKLSLIDEQNKMKESIEKFKEEKKEENVK